MAMLCYVMLCYGIDILRKFVRMTLLYNFTVIDIEIKYHYVSINIFCEKMESSKRDGLERTLTKLRHRLSRGEYYEAHQLYRTLSFR